MRPGVDHGVRVRSTASEGGMNSDIISFDIFISSIFFQRFTWQLTLANFTTCGTGHSKKIAK